MEDDLPRLVKEFAGAELPTTAVAEDDPAVILYTSGTSGRPKGAVHSQRNLLAVIDYHRYSDALLAAFSGAAPSDGPSDLRYLLTSPLFHIASLHNLVVPRLATGSAVVLYQGSFDADRVLRLIEREKVTNWGAVPTMAGRLLEHEDVSRYDTSSLTAFALASAPSSPGFQQRLREKLPFATKRTRRQLRAHRMQHRDLGRDPDGPAGLPGHPGPPDPRRQRRGARPVRRSGPRRHRGRDLCAQPVRDARLLGERRRDVRRDPQGPLAAHRRLRRHRERHGAAHRSPLRPDPARRRERVPGGDRAVPRRASGRRRVRGDRRRPPRPRTGGCRGGRAATGRHGHRGRTPGVRGRAPLLLQGAHALATLREPLPRNATGKTMRKQIVI